MTLPILDLLKTEVYFTGCPKVDVVRALLKQAGASFVEIRQEALPAEHPLTSYSSPTVLAGNEIIIGSKTGDSSSACSVDFPDPNELQRRLRRAGEVA